MNAALPRLRIAQVAPPFEAVPPPGYGGTERVVDGLTRELRARGHTVTLFASADSTADPPRVDTVDQALRPADRFHEGTPWVLATLSAALRRATEFDLIHIHLDFAGALLARVCPTPVVATFHGRLDVPWAAELLADPPAGLVAISAAQAALYPDADWEVVPNGLDLVDVSFNPRGGRDLCFVGRLSPEKGAAEAARIAALSGRRLRVAAKLPSGPLEQTYYEEVFLPAAGDAPVELLGELESRERDELYGASYATLMPGDWPEPFGLVAIESLAAGTPVVTRRVGALPEIVRDGQDGVVGDSTEELAERLAEVAGLDRAAARQGVLERFSTARMVDGYEAVYARRLGLG